MSGWSWEEHKVINVTLPSHQFSGKKKKKFILNPYYSVHSQSWKCQLISKTCHLIKDKLGDFKAETVSTVYATET